MFGSEAHTPVSLPVGRRSLFVKAVGYRLLSVLVTAAIAYLVVRDVAVAFDVGIWANVAKFGLYYAYERAWSRVDRPRPG